MFWLYIALSGIVDVMLICFGSIVNSPWDLWKPVLFFPALFLGFILIHFIVFVLLSFTASKSEQTKNIHNLHRSFMLISLKLFFKIVNVKVNVEGREIIPDDGKFLFVCNHISIYDPIISITVLEDKNIGFVSKKENIETPVAGRYILKSGCIPLDRENTREAVKAINAAADNITNGVCAMGIYPEGYVNKTAKGLLPFRNGAFKIAKKAKVPVVVGVISNTRKINKNLIFRRTAVNLKIVKIIPYEEIADLKTNEIGERVYDLMFNALEEENK